MRTPMAIAWKAVGTGSNRCQQVYLTLEIQTGINKGCYFCRRTRRAERSEIRRVMPGDLRDSCSVPAPMNA